MKLWFTRLIAVMFVASLLMAPQASVLAVETLSEAAETSNGDAVKAAGDNAGAPADTGADIASDPNVGDNIEPDSGEGSNSPDSGTPDDLESDSKNPEDESAQDPDEDPANETSDNDEVAGDDASEGDAEPETGDQPGAGNEVDGDAVPGEEVGVDGEREDASSAPGLQSQDLVAPLNFDAKTVPLPTFDIDTGMLTISVELEVGFSAEAGDEFYIFYEGLQIDPAAFEPSVPVLGINGLVAQLDSGSEWGDIVFTFDGDVEPLATPLSGSISVPATVVFETCRPTIDPYDNEAYVQFGTPTTYGSVWVEGPECAASAEPKFGDVDYNEETGILEIEVLVLEPPAPGQQLTLTYEQNKLAMEPGPFDLVAYSFTSGEFFIVATATANNGLIVIDFHDANVPEGVEIEPEIYVVMTGWLQGDTCATTDAPVYLPGGDLTFVASSGQTFVQSFPSFVCNLAGPGMVGEWGTDDQGEPVIHWTIDTGDIVMFAGVDNLSYMGFGLLIYDCDSLSITSVYGEYVVSDRYCSESSFYYDLDPESDEPFRATITVTTALDFNPEYPPLSIMNCVEIWMMDDPEPEPTMVSALASNGWGGEACYELFMDPAGGDFLTKTVDKTEALPGDVVTYTVEVSTSTNAWNVIDVSDALPEGFSIDPSSISCAVEPAIYQTDPCYVLSESTLRVQVRDVVPAEETPWARRADPVIITLTYSGEITAEPNTSVVNEACSVRHFLGGSGEGPSPQALMQVEGDQSVIGGGRICASVDTLVLQVDVDPIDPTDPTDPMDPVDPTDPVDPEVPGTPVPTEPATPGATPTAPAESDGDPTATSPVTGLPQTGQGSVAGTSALLAAMAAGLLMAAAVGIRVRSPRG